MVSEKSFKKIQRNKRLINVSEIARRLDMRQPYARYFLSVKEKQRTAQSNS